MHDSKTTASAVVARRTTMDPDPAFRPEPLPGGRPWDDGPRDDPETGDLFAPPPADDPAAPVAPEPPRPANRARAIVLDVSQLDDALHDVPAAVRPFVAYALLHAWRSPVPCTLPDDDPTLRALFALPLESVALAAPRTVFVPVPSMPGRIGCAWLLEAHARETANAARPVTVAHTETPTSRRAETAVSEDVAVEDVAVEDVAVEDVAVEEECAAPDEPLDGAGSTMPLASVRLRASHRLSNHRFAPRIP